MEGLTLTFPAHFWTRAEAASPAVTTALDVLWSQGDVEVRER